MQSAGAMRRRTKLEPPPGNGHGEAGDSASAAPSAAPPPAASVAAVAPSDDNQKSRNRRPRRKAARDCQSIASLRYFVGLTQREWTLVLVTAVLVYGGSRMVGGPGLLHSSSGYASVLEGTGQALGDAFGSGPPHSGGGGHPRDPPYLWSLEALGEGRPGTSRVGGSRSGKRRTQHRREKLPVPGRARKAFWYDNQKISMPVIRALRSRGWRKVDEIEDAQMIYTYKEGDDIGRELERWQRFNLIPNAPEWNDKFSFVQRYKDWEARQQQEQGSSGSDNSSSNKRDVSSLFVPESYMLTGASNTQERLAFARRLEREIHHPGSQKITGADHPWVLKEGDVNQGRGITVLAPNSPELMNVPYRFEREAQELQEAESEKADDYRNSNDDEVSDVIVQKYVCNEMTWNKRKFDVRVFWLVASLDPLVVLYHDGYVRIGNSDYSETDFSDTTKHLTTHTKLGAEGKATWTEFAEALKVVAADTHPAFPPDVREPVEHVRNQMKAALGEMIERFREVSFVPNLRELPTDNSYSFYCADFILDNDLDVWFLEPQFGCGLDEDYYFRLEMHASLFNGMADVLEEIWTKEQQQESPPSSLLPLQHQGNWEIVYLGESVPASGDDDSESPEYVVGAGKAFQYPGYTRSRDKAGCDTSK